MSLDMASTFRLEKHRLKSASLLEARFESASGLIESRLHSHHSELAVFDFAVRRHHPDKVDRVARHRHVRMKAFGHNYRVAIADYANEFRLVRICVDELHPE